MYSQVDASMNMGKLFLIIVISTVSYFLKKSVEQTSTKMKYKFPRMMNVIWNGDGLHY